MRKSQTIIKGDNFFEKVPTDIEAFDKLAEDEVPQPTWGLFCFIAMSFKSRIYKVTFFEDSQEFLISYSKFLLLLNHPEHIKIFCYELKNTIWHVYYPPTLIGIDLHTKLR